MMFQRNSPPENKKNGPKDYKQKLELGTSQKPLTNMLHKRNSSSVCNDNSMLLSNSEVN